jgi:hypothetical protein
MPENCAILKKALTGDDSLQFGTRLTVTRRNTHGTRNSSSGESSYKTGVS